MLLNQAFSLKETPRALFWIGIFLISFLGMFYLGLNSELIKKWYLVLVGFNVMMSLVALYYIILSMKKLKKNTEEGVIGSKFTWSFIKIVPVLVLVPVLSFYLFSFGSIRDNLQIADTSFKEFNLLVDNEVDELYRKTITVGEKYYEDRTRNLSNLINYFYPTSSVEEMQTFLNLLIADNWACELRIYNSLNNLVAQSNINTLCSDAENRTQFAYDAKAAENTLKVFYSADQTFGDMMKSMSRFSQNAKKPLFDLNSSIIEKRFMIDISLTILLTVLSALLIVLRMIDQLMRPMHNLSIATREISSGNYDVQIEQDPKNKDMHDLIGHFNEMSTRIKMSREGLDTHNLYLETILKYSFGVIALSTDKKIQLINPVIGKILQIDDESIFVGQRYDDIVKEHDNLSPLFSFIEEKVDQRFTRMEWRNRINFKRQVQPYLLSRRCT